MGEPFGAEVWDERYRSQDRVWSGRPNPCLVSEVTDLPPGRALDVGCGEGADAIWLAERGWSVVAADISLVALQRGAEHAAPAGVAARIAWLRRDLADGVVDLDEFDLVTAQYMQLPEQPRNRMFRRLADRVRGGGALLVVGHNPSDLELNVARPPMPEVYYTPEDVVALLDPHEWEIRAHDSRGREGTDRDGDLVTVHDVVVRARRIRRREPGLPVRYRSNDEDSGRWDGFPFRDGDIVISTRSKSGTTWLQMICALLIFQTAAPPAALSRLSPWLDMLVTPREQVLERLDAQAHRRFIKTHTPLDGVPVDPRATYLVAARNPLDMAVSLYHQGDNLDRARIRELLGQPEPAQPPPRRSLHDWLLRWIDKDVSHLDEMDSLPGVIWHLADAWARRDQPNVVLVHYADLIRDLDGEMRRIAGRLGIDVPAEHWPDLVRAATFASMRSNAERLTPNPSGILKDTAAFFRRGSSGAATEVLSDAELDHYRDRVASMAPTDLMDWLHRTAE